MKVIFSNRAYTALLSETQEKITTETGGIFLGYFENDTWYVVESIDPGPSSIFEVAYFEYDQKYVNHLINKIARMYKKNLSLLGLWHRHPGSFDIFSNTDDGTNHTFAQLAPQGAISALVNIDPKFRLTVYHVPKNLRYKKIPYQVGDEYFPKNVLSLLTTDELLKQINADDNADYARSLQVRLAPKVRLSDIMASICETVAEFDGTKYKDEIFTAHEKEDFVDKVSGEIMEDLEYLSQQTELAVKIKKTARYLCLFDDSEETETRVYFSFIESIGKYVFIYKNKCYLYQSGLFSKVIEDGVNSEKATSLWGNIKKFFGMKRR